MPWKETDVMSERIRFVVEASSSKETMTDLCLRYGISRKTGHKWLRRYREVGSLAALSEESRRPLRSPGRTDPQIEAQVVELRGQHGWGSRKLQRLLEREGVHLGRRTIDRILGRRGLLSDEKRHRPAVTRFERASPNELAQMDFKGPYELASGGQCVPLSVVDDHSRYALALAPMRSGSTENVRRELIESWGRYGVPESILTDHGTPWWSAKNGHGLTFLAVFLIRQGIHLVYSGIGHPQTQGKVERFHRTLGDWLRHHGTPTTLDGFTAACDVFRQEYNEVRPHEALGLDTPSQHYQCSPRQYCPEPRPWEYGDGAEVRRLADNGCLWLEGGYCFVCHSLGGRRVRVDRFDQRLLITYRHMLVREIDRTTGASLPLIEVDGSRSAQQGAGRRPDGLRPAPETPC